MRLKFLLSLFLVISSAVILLFLYEKNRKARYLYNNTEQAQAALWLNAVKNGNYRKAVQEANLLVDHLYESPDVKKNDGYGEIFTGNNINKTFLSAPFNRWDFEIWKQAMFFHNLSCKTISGTTSDTSQLELLLDIVLKRLEKREDQKPVVYNPYVV